MLRECFGVPVLKSYTSAGVRTLCRDFRIDCVSAHGYLWAISLTKP